VLSSAYKNPYRRNVLAEWLADARGLGLTPLITFDRSDRHGLGGRLPKRRAIQATRSSRPPPLPLGHRFRDLE